MQLSTTNRVRNQSIFPASERNTGTDRRRIIAVTMMAIIFCLCTARICLGQNKSETIDASKQNPTATPPLTSGYAPVNGLKLYYEIYGSGKPLILIHGGLGAIEMFSGIIPSLAQNAKVIAVDLQGHGRTGDINRPMSYESFADDMAALLKFLAIEKADFMGYSLGGGVAIQTAIRHPEAVGKLIIVSAAFKRDGWYPEILAGMSQMGPGSAEAMKPTPLYQLYKSLAPKPEDWSNLHTKLSELFKNDYDWSSEIKNIKAPLLVTVGDADAIRTAHAVEFFGLLGGGQHDGGWDGSGRPRARLAILPGLTHYTIFSSPVMTSVVISFLNEP